MRRHELEHVLRAAKGITDEIEFVVIGSQAILAQIPDPPRLLTYSNEVDFYPLHAPEKADLIDGVIGKLSRFHETYGYYAHGVAPETATLALKWRERAVTLETPLMEGAIGRARSPVFFCRVIQYSGFRELCATANIQRAELLVMKGIWYGKARRLIRRYPAGRIR